MPTTDRVLVQIVTAANMTGINEAKAGFLGMSNALSAAVVGIGLVAIASKSAIEITEKREKAENDLAQAVLASRGDLAKYHDAIDKFIESNRAYLSDQSEVIDGYAKLARAGLAQNEVQLDMNRALDLAAIKHISLSDAIDLVNNAEHGRLRGLVDLGITSKGYVDSAGNVINANKNMAKVMAELDAKTAHGRDTLTQTSQATNRLSNDWQDIANIAGPPLLDLFDAILRGADFLLQKLKELGQDRNWNKALSAGFGVLQNNIATLITGFGQIIDAIKWIIDNGQKLANAMHGNGGPATAPKPKGYAAGGYVSPGQMFTVGERGPETMVMGGSGGTVIPNGRGGGGVTYEFHFHDAVYADGPAIDALSLKIAQRLRMTTGI